MKRTYVKKWKKALTFVLVFVLAFSAGMIMPPKSTNAARAKKYVKSLKVTSAKKKLAAGGKAVVKAKVTAKGNVKKTVKAVSSNKKVVAVKVGKVNRKGVTSITVRAKTVKKTSTVNVKITTVGKNAQRKKISKSVKFTVQPASKKQNQNKPTNPVATDSAGTNSTEVLPQSVSITAQTASISVGMTTVVSAKVLPVDAAVTFTTSNPAVATVDQNGIVLGIGVGTAVITASTSNGKTASVTITVTEIPVTEVVLDVSEREITITETTTLKAEVLPANATNKTLIWASSDSNIATVDANGVVKGVAEGEAEISATASNGVRGVCTVTVKRKVVEADGIHIEMINPYEDKDGQVYPNTALVGNDMAIRAQVIRDGMPVGNASVTLSMEPIYGNCKEAFMVRTPTEKTDDNGYANFVIGLKSDQNLDALDEKFQSYAVKAQESASNIS